MPKQKTHKGLGKRIKITAAGKLKRKRCCGSHLMSGKNAKRRRRIGGSAILTGATAKTIKIHLGK
jgi:large subunit ribosomal protein L35